MKSSRFIFNNSFLKRYSVLNREIVNSKKDLADTLMLTSLIDAFSILVIYLLMSFSSAGEMSYANSDVKLPKAQTIERLDKYPVIQITKEQYLIEDKKVTSKEMVSILVSLKKSLAKFSVQDQETITVQADKKIEYSRLSSVIQACSHAGFSNIKFAVLGE